MMVRKSVAVVTVTVGLLCGVAGSAAAQPPGPPIIPALVVKVQDACTHKAVPAVQFSLTDATGLAVVASRTTASGMTFKTLAAGSYRLFVSAPGYDAFTDPSGLLGAPVGVDPGPFSGLNGALTTGLQLGIRLAPSVPPTRRPPRTPMSWRSWIRSSCAARRSMWASSARRRRVASCRT